jgi:hypothetical protein
VSAWPEERKARILIRAEGTGQRDVW